MGCARRNSGENAFGHGFDSRHLHQKMADFGKSGVSFSRFAGLKWHEITWNFARSDNWADKFFSEAWKPVSARVLKISIMVTSTILDRFQYYWNLSFFFLSQYFSEIRDFAISRTDLHRRIKRAYKVTSERTTERTEFFKYGQKPWNMWIPEIHN